MSIEQIIHQVQWPELVVGIVVGIVVAVFGHWLKIHGSRRQPIKYQLRTTTIFAGATEDRFGTVTKLVVQQKGERSEYDNLHAIELTVANAGNVDIPSFKFGVTLPEGRLLVRIQSNPPDRHHAVQISAPQTEADVLPQDIDFTLEPFNRGDQYSLIFQVSAEEGHDLGAPLAMSTPHPVKFVRVLDRTDVTKAATIAAEISMPSLTTAIRAMMGTR